MQRCIFTGCPNEAVSDTSKCLFHLHRSKCITPGCINQVYARSLCVRHGGKRRCQAEGCELNSRKGDFCTKHGPASVLRICNEDGCQSQVHLQGKCFRHGGNRQCTVEGCETFARNRGLCARHTPKPPRPTTHRPNGLSSPASTSSSVHAEVSSLLAYYYQDDDDT